MPTTRPHDVRVRNIQDRTKRTTARRPWVLRWKVDGAEHSRSYATRPEADHVRSLLVIAARTGERFDPASGWPAVWLPTSPQRRLHEWIRTWLAEQWPEWQPRTRDHIVDGLARFVPHVHTPRTPAPPADLRRYPHTALVPDAAIDRTHPCERWMDRWTPRLVELTREMLATAEAAIGVTGGRLGPATIRRYRRTARAPIQRAVDLHILERDPWPPAVRGRHNRTVNRVRRTVADRRLPDPTTMAAVIDALVSPQPASRRYQVMTAVAYYAGLRPSEVVVLRRRHLTLPVHGRGYIDVVEADIGAGIAGAPKTGPRRVPIPPTLVRILTTWIRHRTIQRGDAVFRRDSGKLPQLAAWRRSLARAVDKVGAPYMRIYDCRHAAATTWLRAGVPIAEVARRLGHSVETLVSTYVGALPDDEQLGNQRIETALAREHAEGRSRSGVRPTWRCHHIDRRERCRRFN